MLEDLAAIDMSSSEQPHIAILHKMMTGSSIDLAYHIKQVLPGWVQQVCVCVSECVCK